MEDSLSDHCSIGNGVRQGAVLSPLLFTLYIDMLFIRLQDLCLGCHVGPIFAGSFGYADDVALVAPTLYAMDKMINVCEIFADKIGLLFNPLKSKLLCYNVDNPDTVYVTLRNTTVRTSLHEKHLGNFISNNIYDRILRNMCVDSLVKQMQFYVILDVVIVVLLLTFIELFVWTYMPVNYGT